MLRPTCAPRIHVAVAETILLAHSFQTARIFLSNALETVLNPVDNANFSFLEYLEIIIDSKSISRTNLPFTLTRSLLTSFSFSRLDYEFIKNR